MSYFLFNGGDSRNYGLLESAPMPPSSDEIVNIVETPGRVSNAFYATGRYENKEITVVLGIKDKLKIRALYGWISGTGSLILSSELDKCYRVVKIAKTPERLSVRFGKVAIVFTVEPFAYSISPTTVDITSATSYAEVDNEGTMYSEPEISFVPTASEVKLDVNGKEFVVSGLAEQASAGRTVVIDCGLEVVYYVDGGAKVDITYKSKYDFPLLHTGKNYVKHNGNVSSASVNVKERWL